MSNEALRGMCENVMHLLTTTVDKMENVSIVKTCFFVCLFVFFLERRNEATV